MKKDGYDPYAGQNCLKQALKQSNGVNKCKSTLYKQTICTCSKEQVTDHAVRAGSAVCGPFALKTE